MNRRFTRIETIYIDYDLFYEGNVPIIMIYYVILMQRWLGLIWILIMPMSYNRRVQCSCKWI